MTTKTKAMENNATVVGIVKDNELIPEAQINLYNSVVDNIRAFSTSKSRKNNIGIVAINLSLLYVDEQYQGLRNHKRINKLVDNWDERKLAPITVVPHPEEYRFAVVDGQGRLMAAHKLKYKSLQALVLLDAPTDTNERLKFEATYFINQDEEIEHVKPLEKHPARVIIGDETALILEDLFKSYHITYTNSRRAREAGVLGSYPTTYEIVKRNGRKCLEFIFSIIKNAGWDEEPNGYATFVTESLKDIWSKFPCDRERIYNYLSEEFRKIDPSLFSSRARTCYPMRKDTRKICKLYLEDLLIKELGIKKIA